MTIRLVSNGRFLRSALAFCAALLLANGAPLLASVQVTGDVSPSDNPFTDINTDPTTGEVTGNEGIQEFIPFFGDFFDPPGSVPDQYTFETDEDIEVGTTSFGSLLLNGGSIVRYKHLVIGGIADDANSEAGDDVNGSELGVGVVRIEGFGTVYNSDPAILPGGFPVLNDPSDRMGEGFDVYVGLTGSGTLEVADGGRMEIGDGLIAGLASGAYGEILVEGFGSHIDQRGSGEGDDSLSQMLIGPAGTGVLTIRDGAQADARGGAALGAATSSGTIRIAPGGGGLPFFADSRGGHGVATVDGLGSTWRVAGGLAIGVFNNDINMYTSGDGIGELTVSERGLVSVIENADDDPASLLVGANGRVVLGDGDLVVGGDVVSDGVFVGDGSVATEHFSSRRLGEIHVGTGQQMVVSSTATMPVTDDVGAFYMANDGLIEVIGGQIEFQRLAGEAIDMFKNRVAPATADLPEKKGVILGQNSIMRFRSGLSNEGVLAFTAGNSVIGGDVINEAGAQTIISGFSNVTFEDDLTNNGVLDLAPDGSIVTITVLGDFVGMTSGSLNLNLGGGLTGAELSHLAVAGDITLGGELHIDLSTTGTSPIDPMPGDEFEIISGASALSGAFNLLDLPAISNPGWNWLIDTADSDVTLVVTDIMPIGGDFDGNGIVDALDLAIWQANFGLNSGATGVLGDADGDGDVDGADYFIWLDQVGGPGMGAGALTFGPTAVPEPSTMVLALAGLLGIGLAYRRRR